VVGNPEVFSYFRIARDPGAIPENRTTIFDPNASATTHALLGFFGVLHLPQLAEPDNQRKSSYAIMAAIFLGSFGSLILLGIKRSIPGRMS
jgi:hypothetical protein